MRKRKLTKQEKAAKKLRQQNFMTVFIRGKQKRVRRPPMVEGLEVDEFIRRNADPVWLHQNEMWELIEEEEYGSSGVAVGVLPAEEEKVTAAKTTAVGLQEPVECPF